MHVDEMTALIKQTIPDVLYLTSLAECAHQEQAEVLITKIKSYDGDLECGNKRDWTKGHP